MLRYIEEDVPGLAYGRQQKVHAKAIREAIRGKAFEDVPDVISRIRLDAKGKSMATVNRRLSLLRRLGHKAEEWGWIERAPRVRLQAEQERTVRLSQAQIEALAKRMPRCGDIVRLAACTGLRRRELLELTKESVKGKALLVRTLKQRQETFRTVPVPKRAQRLLKGIPWPVTDQILRVEWEEARKDEGLPDARFHDLRHHYGTLLVEAGLSDRVVMELMGHKDPRMVRRYSHLRDEGLAAMVERL